MIGAALLKVAGTVGGFVGSEMLKVVEGSTIPTEPLLLERLKSLVDMAIFCWMLPVVVMLVGPVIVNMLGLLGLTATLTPTIPGVLLMTVCRSAAYAVPFSGVPVKTGRLVIVAPSLIRKLEFVATMPVGARE